MIEQSQGIDFVFMLTQNNVSEFTRVFIDQWR